MFYRYSEWDGTQLIPPLDAEEALDLIADDLLAGREFFFEHFTAADAHFFWCLRRAKQFELDLAKFANCNGHFDRIQNRPSVQKALAYEHAVQTEFAKAAA